MKKVGILVLAAATAMVLAVGSGSAVAAAPVVEACEAGPDGITGTADDGTYVKDGSEAGCVFPPENVGNAPEHSNAQETQTIDTGHGNLNNRPESECTGPPGQCAQ